jgi:hypothetical protein
VKTEEERRQQAWNEKQARAKVAADKRGDSEFVNLELSKAQRADAKQKYGEPVLLDTALFDLFDDGTKVTVKYDDRNRCVVAFGFAPSGGENDGYILTGRGSSVTRALMELAYKHHDLLGGQWSQYHNLTLDRDEDDW